MNGTRLLLAALIAVCILAPHAHSMRPNFVLIIGDDISAADLGCFGNTGVRTPHLDRLARESLRFTRAYVTATSCSPSRCSMLTSRYPHNLEAAAELHGALAGGVALFPQLLRESGYYTAHAGKAHFGTQANNGVQRVVGPAEAAFEVSGDGEPVPGKGGYGGEEQWLQRLRNRPTDRPFFFWLAAHDAHRIWDADDFAGRHTPADVTVPPELVDTSETRQDLASYYDEIHRLDHHVGQVVEELRRQGVLEQTVILFLSDQGRPFPRAKTQVYEAGVLTPLIIRLPQALGDPGVVDALVSSIDLGPTVLELAGIARPASFQGVSLTPLFRNPRASVRDFVFAERNWHN
ncbi:MAG: sulfatase, partial [Opitutaceae bacterium]|nr:sulfatase [Opitutaceae bacterium]